MDEDRRIALQELFKSRMKNLSIEKPSDYVSPFVTPEPVVKPPTPHISKAQASNGMQDYIYQFDSECFSDGNHVPAHAPELLSPGTGHVFINKKDKQGDFLWACG